MRMKGKKRRLTIAVLAAVLSVALFGTTAGAAEKENAAMDTLKAPGVEAGGAVLMDIDTGVVLYEKNSHEKYYPASITKLLTCLVAAEHTELTDIVTFSHRAVFDLERGATHIGIDEGQQMSMKDCYYAILLVSANEVASGVAEHVGGSIEGFAAMMNEKVAQLGGSDSHFMNANGLNNDEQHTSAYDMALIGRAFARNDMLLEISGTDYYHISATEKQPDEIDLRNHHRMMPGCKLSNARPYEYMIGGKTGYTSKAGNTLVTFAEKDGRRLVCVVLKESYPKHYTDTLALFEYGFACYENPQMSAQLAEKAAKLQAEEDAMKEGNVEPEEDVSAGEASVAAAGGQIVAEGETSAKEEPDEQADTPDGTSGAEEGNDPQKAENGKKSELTGKVILIILSAVGGVFLAAAGGAFFYRNYKRERELASRRAEIMERHRMRKGA